MFLDIVLAVEMFVQFYSSMFQYNLLFPLPFNLLAFFNRHNIATN